MTSGARVVDALVACCTLLVLLILAMRLLSDTTARVGPVIEHQRVMEQQYQEALRE